MNKNNITTLSKATDVAKIIRSFLKEQPSLKTIKFSVTSSRSYRDLVYLAWCDGLTVYQLRKLMEENNFRFSDWSKSSIQLSSVEYKRQTYQTNCNLGLIRYYSKSLVEKIALEVLRRNEWETKDGSQPTFKVVCMDSKLQNYFVSLEDSNLVSKEKQEFRKIVRTVLETTNFIHSFSECLSEGDTEITVIRNEEKDGVEIRFPDKPAQEILDQLWNQGFYWSGFSRCWYKKYSQEAWDFAQSLKNLNASAEKAEDDDVHFVEQGINSTLQRYAGEIKQLSLSQTAGYYPTPDNIANYLVELANIQVGDRVLEPTAGSGNLARTIAQSGKQSVTVRDATALLTTNVELICVERNQQLFKYLEKWADCYEPPIQCVHDDWFLYKQKIINYPPDIIIANPPWGQKIKAGNHDFDHVRSYYEVAKKRVVSLVHYGTVFHEKGEYKKFREWMQSVNAQIITAMPDGSPIAFSVKESGTSCNAAIVVINKTAEFIVPPDLYSFIFEGLKDEDSINE